MLATDTGGTFTDAVLISSDGSIHAAKRSSTPRDLSIGALDAMRAAATAAGTTLDEVCRASRVVGHGTTASTNALVEGSLASTGLLISAGFEDTLEIGRTMSRTVGLRPDQLTDFPRLDRPEPIVPFDRVRGIRERIDSAGNILAPLDRKEAERMVDGLVDAGTRALAVCLLWAFGEPRHERMLGNWISARHPGIYLSLSSDLLPVLGEYGRANTTALNAALGPVLEAYLEALEARLRQASFDGQLLIMQSLGGLAPAEQARRTPVATLYSGPVGGIVAATALGREAGLGDLITADMGGTTFDVGLVVDGEPEASATTTIGRHLALWPSVEVKSIGAGGGSIAWIDELGGLRVGPQSAGAVPGPACYARGGSVPTVTDADLLLGLIDHEQPIGGEIMPDRGRAEAALRLVAEPLGMTVPEAAAAIVSVVEAQMADLIREVTIERGHDPRGFTLVAYGGAGPVHGIGVASELGIDRILIPGHAAIFSALGIAGAPIRHVATASVLVALERGVDLAPVTGAVERCRERLRHLLAAEGLLPGATLIVGLDARFRGQIHTLTVPASENADLEPATIEQFQAAFRSAYERRYGQGSAPRDATVEVTGVRVDAVAPSSVGIPPTSTASIGAGSAKPAARRQILWPGHRRPQECAVYRWEALPDGAVVAGPALIQGASSAIPLPRGYALSVNGRGDCLVVRE